MVVRGKTKMVSARQSIRKVDQHVGQLTQEFVKENLPP